MKRALAMAAAAFMGLAAARSEDAHATPTSRLTYVRGRGAETCPDEAELRHAVSSRLGYDPFFAWANRTVVAQIEQKSGGYVGELKILDANGVSLGERTLPTVTRDCPEIVRSLALAISIAIDDLDVAAPPPATPPEAAVEEPVATNPGATNPGATNPLATNAGAAPEKVPPRSSTEVNGTRLKLAVELAALGNTGSAPSIAGGGAVGARLVGSWWSAGLEGRFDLPASRAVPGGGRVETRLVLGNANACARAGASWRVFACALGAVGSFSATATDVSGPHDASARYLAVGLRLGGEVDLGSRFYAFAHVGGLGSFTPHRTVLDNETVFTLPVVSGQLALGIGARIF